MVVFCKKVRAQRQKDGDTTLPGGLDSTQLDCTHGTNQPLGELNNFTSRISPLKLFFSQQNTFNLHKRGAANSALSFVILWKDVQKSNNSHKQAKPFTTRT